MSQPKKTLHVISPTSELLQAVLSSLGVPKNELFGYGYANTENYEIYYKVELTSTDISLSTDTLAKFSSQPQAVVLLLPDALWVPRLGLWLLSFKNCLGRQEAFQAAQMNYLDRKAKYLGGPVRAYEFTSPLGYDLIIHLPEKAYMLDNLDQIARVIALQHGGAVCAAKLSDLLEDSCVPNAVSSSKLMIPSGYDSIGKIETVDDDFQVLRFAEIWQNYMNDPENLRELTEFLEPYLEEKDVVQEHSSRLEISLLQSEYEEFLAFKFKEEEEREYKLKQFMENTKEKNKDI